jgi:homocysteine S-methyltransferase
MPNADSLLQRLAEAPLVGDGAMGTYLHELGHDILRGPEALVLQDPEAVRRAHAAYLEAGAELLETNTFGANVLSLAAQGHAAQVREINAAAARLALAAAGSRAWVAGAIGPVALAPHDEGWDEARVRAAYREQAQVLCESGVHALLLETFDDLDALLLALGEARAVAGARVPLIAQLVFTDGRAASGVSAQDAAQQLVDAGAAIVGANCGSGLPAIRSALDGLLAGAGTRAFVSAYPNAGFPERINGRTVYLSTPAYIATQAAEWAGRGVRLIGGCCGTTPETIRAIRNALAAMRRVPRSGIVVTGGGSPAPAASGAGAPLPLAPVKPGGFLAGLQERLPVIAEIDPPPHLEWQPVAAGARALLEAGAQAISLAENPLALVRMDNLFLGALIRRETGGQVVCHVTCRDRNSIGLQSALLAAHTAGIEAVLAVTGDPAQRGGHQRVVSVYELTSPGLVRLIAGMNRGRTAAGRDLRGTTNFSIGVAFNSASPNLAAEAARLRRKQAEGAVFTMTQPVFTADQARRVLEHARLDGMRVFLGFLPPVTHKLALYLHHEVPGIRLPETLLERLASFADPADQQRAALEHTTQLIASLAGELDGLYLITPGNRWQALLPLLEQVRKMRA